MKNKAVQILTCIFIVIPPAIYFSVVSKFALNLPYNDDYPAILTFLNNYKISSGVARLCLLFEQYNEHRLLSTRLITAAYYSISGNINFRHLIFIGNLQLVVSLLICIRFAYKALPGSWQLPSILMSLFIFDLTSWNNAGWAMASLQNYGVIMLFLLSLFFYSLDKKRYYILGSLFQIIGTFSSGSGIIASFFIAIYSALSKKRYKMIFAIITFAIFTPLYFFHYASGHSTAYGMIDFAISYLQLTSGHFYIGKRNYNAYIMETLSVLYLIGILVYTPVSKNLNIKKEHLPLVCLTGFILATFAVISRYRIIHSASVPSRYLIYCHMLTGILFLFYLIRRQTKYTKPISIIFTVLMLVCYERNFRYGYGGFKKWYYTVRYSLPDPWTPVDYAELKIISDKSCQLHIYCIEQERMKINN